MKLEKAIEIKTRTGEEFLKTDSAEIDEADRLSIKALEAIKVERTMHGFRRLLRLTGETKE